MAEETAKMDETKDKTVGIETTVDELLSQKSEQTKSEGEGSHGDESHQESKDAGWLTSLPKELRDGVDTTKYSSLAEYIKDLKEHQQKEVKPATKEEVDAQWSELFEEAKGATEDEQGMLKEIIDTLKEQGVAVDDARKTLTAYGNTAKKLMDKKSSDAEKAFADYIDQNWGENSKQFFDEANRGIRYIASEDIGLLKTAKEQGLTKNPAFIEVCRLLGGMTDESSIGEASKGGKKEDFDPRNPLQYKH